MSKESKVFVRLKKVIMVNFRNIEFGKVDFPSSTFEEYRAEEPSIMGLYGQNGSGKTSLVMAVSLLKRALSGVPLNGGYDGCIRSHCDSANLQYEFTYCDEDGTDLTINYSFRLSEAEVDSTDDEGNPVKEDVLRISDEVLYFSGYDADGNKVGKTIVADTSADASKKGYAFGRDRNYEAFVGKDKELANKLREVKAVRYSDSKSFVFGEDLYDIAKSKINDDISAQVLVYLHTYGAAYLHVIDNHATGINNMNVVLPLVIWGINDKEHLTSANAMIRMGRHEQAAVPENRYEEFCEAVRSFNEVLCKLVPGLQVEIEDFGTSKDGRGNELHLFSLNSKRNNTTIPLNCESDGIRRIISIMSLLIGVYNQRSMTVVIDEIDSGIYEYLLGEILRIMCGSARGQLIFTSHNLRPLEVLPSKYICFTSTNPTKRYVKLVKTGNSNLRDMYFKKIVLGSDDEQLYDPTDNYEIELAFYNAGRIQDKTL